MDEKVLSNKKVTNCITNSMDKSQKYFSEWKEPYTEGYILYDSIYMKL